MSNRVISLFDWNINSIIEKLDEIKSTGWDSILTSPMQPCKKTGYWWGAYQVMDLKIGNKYGSEKDLIRLIQKAHKLGLNVYVDTVITHYANKGSGNERFVPNEEVNEMIANNKWFWRDKKDIDYSNRHSITHNCNGLPSIDISNYEYQNLVIDFYNKLINDIGIDGLRIDSCKMIACPEEFNENNMFFKRVLEKLDKNIFVFGEVIHENKDILRLYQKYVTVLTNLSDEAYSIDRDKELVFNESHDTYLNDNEIGYTKRLSNEQILQNYKYLIKDFPNTVFYTRPFCDDWKIANK